MINKIAGIVVIENTLPGIAGEALAQFDICYLGQDGKYYKASAANEATMPGTVIAENAVPIDGAGNFIYSGIITNNNWQFITGKIVHIGVIPGTLTHEFPGSGQQLQLVGIASATNQINFMPNIMLIEVA